MLNFKEPIKWMLLLSMGLAVTACDQPAEESETEEEEDVKTPGGISSGGVAAGNSDTFSVLGTWLRDTCKPAAALKLQGNNGDEGNGGEQGADGKSPERETTTFNDDSSMAIKLEVFMDAECANKMAELNIGGTYLVGSELSADPATKTLDLSITTATITLLKQEIVDMFNGSAGLVGEGEGDGAPCTRATPWVLNEVVDLSTVECKDDLPVPGQVIYSAVSVVGDEMRQSHGGDDSNESQDGKTPETRQVNISKEEQDRYLKQAAAE